MIDGEMADDKRQCGFSTASTEAVTTTELDISKGLQRYLRPVLGKTLPATAGKEAINNQEDHLGQAPMAGENAPLVSPAMP